MTTETDMSLPLVDLRAKITLDTDLILDVVAKTSGRDRSELIRDILGDWAEQRRHEAIVIGQELEAKGLGGLERRARGNRGARA